MIGDTCPCSTPEPCGRSEALSTASTDLTATLLQPSTYRRSRGSDPSWSVDCSNVWQGAVSAMVRIGLGVMVLTMLVATYWFHPTTAWVILGTTFTLAVANRVRQHDQEAEGALQGVDE